MAAGYSDPNEYADAVCEPHQLRAIVPDAEVAGLVLFADVEFEDAEAVAYRMAEWEALFR
jgi:hypothetical protein